MIAMLYRFIFPLKEFRYTTAPQPLTHNSQVYEPEYITDNGFTLGPEVARSELEMHMARDVEVAAEWIGGIPAQTIELERWQHVNGVTSLTWLGRVMGVNWSGPEVVMRCESIYSSLQRAGLRFRYQKNCRHALYSQGRGRCNVTKSDKRGLAPISARTDMTIDADVFGQYPEGWLTGGLLESPKDGSSRAIVQHVGDRIWLGAALLSTVVGETVYYYPGCDHTLLTCRDKFSNQINYGGFTEIAGPNKNPFGFNPIF